MDKRLINFMLVSMLLIVGYVHFMNLVAPPPIPPPNQAAQNANDDENGGEVGAETEPAEIAESNQDKSSDGDATPEAVATAESDPAVSLPPATPQRFTIGSLDPADGYPMLVTLNSRGGAVERVELSDPRYHDLEDKTAYIGHFEASEAADQSGIVVAVVGAGTPAARGGVRVGDIISAIGGESVRSSLDLQQRLAEFEPGSTIPLTIHRRQDETSPLAKVELNLASTHRPMEIIRPETTETGSHPFSYLLSIQQIAHRAVPFDKDEFANFPSLRNDYWYAETKERDGATLIEFRFPLGPDKLANLGLKGSMEVVKRFWFRPDVIQAELTDDPDAARYHFDFEVEVVNHGTENLEVVYRLDGPTGLPLEGWWYSYKTHPTNFSGAGMRDLVYRAHGQAHKMTTNTEITKKMKDEPDNPDVTIVASGSREPFEYAGVDAQYFHSALLAAEPASANTNPTNVNSSPNTPVLVGRLSAHGFKPVDALRANRTDVTFRLESTPLLIPAGKNAVQPFRIFAGPKRPKLLEKYGLQESIVYGWFKLPAIYLGKLLHFLYSIVGNYGIAIVLLTVIARGAMFPFGRQQALNAQKMQELTPEIKKIKEKFPNDLEKQTAAQQELFRKHKYNPAAGCIPVFLQLPIFMGLYRALSVDIELRQQPLIPGVGWCTNLAAPDMLYRWDHFMPKFLAGFTGYLGPYLNLLPLVSVSLFVVHQQMFTPPPTDEQQEQQQKIMKFMTIIMGFLFFKVPAGLCLYFITSSLWALAERKLLPLPASNKDDGSTPLNLAEVQSRANESRNNRDRRKKFKK